MHQAPVVPHADVLTFARNRRLHGRGIGWIDAHLLASSLVGRLKLWTTDPRLMIVAKELDISYAQESRLKTAWILALSLDVAEWRGTTHPSLGSRSHAIDPKGRFLERSQHEPTTVRGNC
jgi:hypothetical protein